jgi:hypothetical protein
MLPRRTGGPEIKALLGDAPVFLQHWINFYFKGKLAARDCGG